jgi:hypothetical protein
VLPEYAPFDNAAAGDPATRSSTMAREHVRMMWQVRPRGAAPFGGRRREQYGAIVASYGGTASASGGQFRRYRAAEACAGSVRSELGVETDVELTREGDVAGRSGH